MDHAAFRRPLMTVLTAGHAHMATISGGAVAPGSGKWRILRRRVVNDLAVEGIPANCCCPSTCRQVAVEEQPLTDIIELSSGHSHRPPLVS